MDRGAIAWLGLGLVACSADWDAYDPRLSSSNGPTGAGGGGATSAGGAGAVAVGGAGAIGGTGAGATGGGPLWLDEGLTARRPLDVALPDGSVGGVTDFPVAIRIDATRLPDVVPELRFSLDDHTTLLAHEVEKWDADGVSVVWLEVPTLDVEPLRVWMYYGGSAQTTAIDVADVWSNDFVAVWHLGESLDDSTQGVHHATAVGAVPADGLVGDATAFDGDGDFLDVGAAAAFDGLFVGGGTLSVLIQPTTPGEQGRGRIVDRTSTTAFTGGWSLLMSHSATPDSVGFAHAFAVEEGWWTTPAGSMTYGEWRQVAVTFDDLDAEPALYLDGAPQTAVIEAAASGAPAVLPNLDVRIGGRSGGLDRDFIGEIDELRAASTVRSPAWIAAEWATASGDLAAIGDAETLP